jgi:hypothetical protein
VPGEENLDVVNARAANSAASTGESASWAHDGHSPVAHINR